MINQPTMGAARFEEILKQLGISKSGASLFFGVTDRTMRRWIAEDHIARPVAMVLELMIEKNLTPEEMLIIAKVRPAQIKFIVHNLYDQRRVSADE